MRFRQRHNLPQLLALLSTPGKRGWSGQWGPAQQPGLARLQQLIRLARHGLREYNEKLDSIDRRLLRGEWNHGEEHSDDDEPRHHEQYAHDEEYETVQLSRAEIHRLFERLALHHHSLNARGYPYTSDVNEEREQVYRDSESLDGREVEEAWDDWKDYRAKKLFSRHRGAEDPSERRESDEGGERKRESGDREELTLLSDLVRAAIERAFEDLEKSRRHQPEPVVRVEVAPDAVERESRRGPAQHCAFSIFDEILLNFDGDGSAFTPENLPRLSEINSRLGEYGEPPFGDEDAMRREWIAYVVSAATVRKRKATEEPRKPDEDITVTIVSETDVPEIENRAKNGHAFAGPVRRNKPKSSNRDL